MDISGRGGGGPGRNSHLRNNHLVSKMRFSGRLRSLDGRGSARGHAARSEICFTRRVPPRRASTVPAPHSSGERTSWTPGGYFSGGYLSGPAQIQRTVCNQCKIVSTANSANFRIQSARALALFSLVGLSASFKQSPAPAGAWASQSSSLAGPSTVSKDSLGLDRTRKQPLRRRGRIELSSL